MNEFLGSCQPFQGNQPVKEFFDRVPCGICEIIPDEELTIMHDTTLSCSLGAALFPQDGGSFKKLYPKADAALYQAKPMGRNRAIIYKK